MHHSRTARRNSPCATGRQAGWLARPRCWWARPRCWWARPRCWWARPRCWWARPRCWWARPQVVDAITHPTHPEIILPGASGQESGGPELHPAFQALAGPQQTRTEIVDSRQTPAHGPGDYVSPYCSVFHHQSFLLKRSTSVSMTHVALNLCIGIDTLRD